MAAALVIPSAALAQGNGRQQDGGQRGPSNGHAESRSMNRGDNRGMDRGGNRDRSFQQHSQAGQSNRTRVEYRDRSNDRPAPRADTRYDAGRSRGFERAQPSYRNDRNFRDRDDHRADYSYRPAPDYRVRPGYRVGYGWHGGFSPDYIGSRHVWRLEGGGLDRFFFNGFYFRVSAYDYPNARGWYWDRDNIIIYDDPDNAGCYLAFNVRLGTYLHVTYIGN